MKPILLFIQVFALQVLAQEDEENEYCKLCDPPGTHTMCEYPDEGPSLECSEYTKADITQKVKDAILLFHNTMRNDVALGFGFYNSIQHPPAAKMMQLSWDEELQTIAQRWADQCVKMDAPQSDVCRDTKMYQVGQSVTANGHPNLEEVDYKRAMATWFEEIHNYKPEWIHEYTGNPEPPKEVSHYTQFVWDKTQYIGCAFVTFLSKGKNKGFWVSRIVCNYAPGGNVIGQTVYKVGRPCSECPPGTLCNDVFGGLCASPDQMKESSEIDSRYLHQSPAEWVEDEYPERYGPPDNGPGQSGNSKDNTEKTTLLCVTTFTAILFKRLM